MKHLGTVFWVAILAGSLACVAAGFTGASNLHSETVAQLQALKVIVPGDVQSRELTRQLVGAHSLVMDDDDPPPIDDVVVRRSGDWAPPADRSAVAQHPRLALIVTDCGHALPLDSQFAALPVPLTLALDPDGDSSSDLARALHDRPFLLSIPDAIFDNPSDHALDAFSGRLAAFHPEGVVSPLSGSIDGSAAQRIVARLPDASILVDGMAGGDPTVYRFARERGLSGVTRDIVIDAHDDPHYVGFMLKQAASLALHTGVAVAVARSRPDTLAAIAEALPAFERDGIEIVPVEALAPKTITQR
jgi:polysaccharide deacetylase 2 family uncharacterized protein YibQ